MITLLLKTGGFEALGASGGQEGLELVLQEHPDLVVLDIMMPDIDGIEVCRRLKEEASTRDITVLFLTAKTGEEHTAEALDAGGSGYIVKPFKARELLDKIIEMTGETGPASR